MLPLAGVVMQGHQVWTSMPTTHTYRNIYIVLPYTHFSAILYSDVTTTFETRDHWTSVFRKSN